ncbi:MAG: hypothetical protein ACLGGV_00860 [Bacteroidia bacterium]
MKQTLIFFSALILIACGNNFKEEIKQVKELENTLLETEKEFLTMEINKISEAKEKYTENIAVFKQKYIPDTVDQKLANDLDGYKYIKKSSSMVMSNYSKLTESIDLCKKQLSDLISDMEHDALTKEDVVKYMEQERFRTSETVNMIKETKKMYDEIIKINDSLGPKIDKVVDSLRKL